MPAEVEITISFSATVGDLTELPDGTIIVFGATITAPEKWAGQRRDLIRWADGSVHLGRDLTRAEGDEA